MPFVTLPREGDVEMYYEFHEPKFDPSKPTALFLAPAISCSALIHQYVLPQLPKLTRQFNCLSVDLRGHGRTKNPPCRGMDCFVFAADIAFNALHIPAVHLVANSYVACPTAFAFPVLFPSAVLSLSILGCAPLNSMPSQLPALMELLEGWLQGDDEEALFDSMNAILDLAFTASSRPGDSNLRDWLSNMWLKNPEITREELASIECPVLLVQGTDDMMRDIPFAQDTLASLSGGVCFVGIANLKESGPLLTRFLLSHKSILPCLPTTSIPFPPPPASSSSGDITSFSYSRFDHANPLIEQLWQLCSMLDGNALVTFADRECQPWEVGGRLDEVSAFKWRFSQRNRNERTSTNSRRGSVPQIKQDCATTVVTFEEVPLPGIDFHDDEDDAVWTRTTTRMNPCYRRRSRNGNITGYRRPSDAAADSSSAAATIEFRTDTWKSSSEPVASPPAPFSVRENGLVFALPSDT
ncbi:hypothetical protein JCM11491_003544 [Sporobolomyces phaffii]